MTTEEIKRLADLSKLKFDQQQLENFTKDFEEIEAFFEQINKVDIAGEKEYRPTREFEQLREDIILPSQERELVLKNAPKKDSISFVVPKVVE